MVMTVNAAGTGTTARPRQTLRNALAAALGIGPSGVTLERAGAAAIRNGQERIEPSGLEEPEIWRGLGLPAQGSTRLRPAALVRTGN
jgi:hypothetical protein